MKDHFYLSGGTALAGFYLHHRYSEDLDFFSETEIDIAALTIVLKKAQRELGCTSIDFQQSYNRNLFFLRRGTEALKIEFTYFPFTRIEKGIEMYGVHIDSLLDIAVNKLFTIYQRTTARDYIDLYFICKEQGFSIAKLLSHAKAKFDFHIDPLQLGVQFIKATEARDFPRMIEPLAPEVWETFFTEEAKKLKAQILI